MAQLEGLWRHMSPEDKAGIQSQGLDAGNRARCARRRAAHGQPAPSDATPGGIGDRAWPMAPGSLLHLSAHLNDYVEKFTGRVNSVARPSTVIQGLEGDAKGPRCCELYGLGQCATHVGAIGEARIKGHAATLEVDSQ